MDASINALQNSNLTLVSTVIIIVVSAIGTALTVYVTSLAKKYHLDKYDSEIEKLIDKAIHYAENEITDLAQGEMSKHDLAIKYIEKISPETIVTQGNKLSEKINTKLTEVIEKKLES